MQLPCLWISDGYHETTVCTLVCTQPLFNHGGSFSFQQKTTQGLPTCLPHARWFCWCSATSVARPKCPSCFLLFPAPRLATKATDEIKVFSRSVPWEALGREKDVRVFVARTLNPGEVPPPPASLAAALLARKAEEESKQDAPLSRKQRKLRERAQRAKALRAAAAEAAVVETNDEGSDQQQEQGNPMGEEEMPDVAAAKDAGVNRSSAAAKRGDLMMMIPSIDVTCTASSTTSYSTGAYTSSNSSSKGNSSPAASPFANAALQFSVEAEGPRIHGCVVFDPIYHNGEVVGYTAERMFIHPQGNKGAIKHIQREALALLKAEGKQLLNLGLAACYQIKQGKASGRLFFCLSASITNLVRVQAI